MSRLEIDTNGFGHATFDLRTGKTVYLSDLPPWHTRIRNFWRDSIPWPVKVLAGVASAGVAWQALEFYLLLKRRQSIHTAATKGEVEDYATLLYTLASRHVGGFLTNATIEAVARDLRDPAHVLLFANGGWSHTPHSLAALPMYRYPSGVCHNFADLDDRTLWWVACSLGKSMQFNGALAFILASVLLQQELAEKEESQHRGDKSSKSSSLSKTRRLTYKGRTVTNVGICTGSLYQKVDATNATASAPASNPFTPLINRIDVACEIGTIDPQMVLQYQMEHWGMIPDIRSEELAQVCQFGTNNVWDYFRSHAALPIPHQTPELERVLWEKKQVKPPSGKDVWVWIEVDNRQKFAVDAALFFAKGIQTGFVDQLAASTTATKDDASSSSGVSNSNSGIVQRASSVFTSLWQRVQGLSTAVVDRLLCNAGALPSPSSMPLAHIFPYDRVLTSSGLGYNSLVREDISGPRNVLRFLQSKVLINEEDPNATHAQLRNLLLESLKLTNLSNKLLTHKLDSLPAYRDKAQVEKEWSNATPSYSPSNQPKKAQGRSAKNRAKKQKAAAAAAATPAHVEEISNDEADEAEAEEEQHFEVDSNSAANQVD